MAKLSFAEIKRRLQGQEVIRRVTGRPTVESIPAIRQALQDELAKQNAIHGTSLVLTEDENKIAIEGTGRFWMKPKLTALAVGKIGFRAKDYCFTPHGATEGLWGDIKIDAFELRETGFTRRYEDGLQVSYDLA